MRTRTGDGRDYITAASSVRLDGRDIARNYSIPATDEVCSFLDDKDIADAPGCGMELKKLLTFFILWAIRRCLSVGWARTRRGPARGEHRREGSNERRSDVELSGASVRPLAGERGGDSEARIALPCRPDAGAGAGAGAGRWRVAERTRTVDGRSVEARCDRRPLAPRRLRAMWSLWSGPAPGHYYIELSALSGKLRPLYARQLSASPVARGAVRTGRWGFTVFGRRCGVACTISLDARGGVWMDSRGAGPERGTLLASPEPGEGGGRVRVGIGCTPLVAGDALQVHYLRREMDRFLSSCSPTAMFDFDILAPPPAA
ncbi:hypothetical protein B0H13DRAFT_2538791 [Mycena leptocephala]|nr:hypothetical protein B0H13DRAFT_2538791 [Mycena leptocephala]